ncbi:hypothetical protein BB559_001726 [Furculomyces boomerangus]|uniref:Phosphatidylethanolamine N-methyltransferase n=1 Tax=Furculomyces boomerangus TaxID=61424 RepID=A0A2T9Z0Z7_9FUNG|nr:hypothetical protein BB559_001726 [Furculomyces boomerangus]
MLKQRKRSKRSSSQPSANKPLQQELETPNQEKNINSQSDDCIPNSEENILIGTTPDGKEFKVPKTTNMISSLFDLNFKKKTIFDYLTLTILAAHIMVYFYLSQKWSRIILCSMFAFWRIGYNLGLGVLLRWQSQRQGLVTIFKRYGLDKENNGGKFGQWIKYQLENKMGSDYNFDEVALEFNVWLIFRHLVDLILMCDFTSYFLFALSFSGSATNDVEWWQVILRQFGGWFLVLFNLWVKIDAHRVIKDYAWYWGDFFFKVEQWLIFDGVFEMAPHPMYSIGYAGYYGASLITGSYVVFFASLAAHILQFVFLSFVENPHIEKTYEKPPIVEEVIRINKEKQDLFEIPNKVNNTNTPSKTDNPTNPIIRAELVGLSNFTFFRPVDFLIMLLVIYGCASPILFECLLQDRDDIRQILMYFGVVNCVFWIIIRSIGLGYILYLQSRFQWWTKWFIKRGGSLDEAFQNWKAFYNTCIVMTYASFFLLAGLAYKWKGGTPLSLYFYNNEHLQHTLFRYSLGFMFIGLQVWCSKSIYSALGDFGWFYGDFFLPQSESTTRKLYYTVEAPFMKKLYGKQIRTDSGVTKSLKRAIEKNSLAKVLVIDIPKKLIPQEKNDSEIPKNKVFWVSKKRIDGETFPTKNINETSNLLQIDNVSENVSDTRKRSFSENFVPSELRKVENLDLYSFQLENQSSSGLCKDDRMVYLLGEPISVSWEAPVTHSREDWIGIYKVTSNILQHMSTVSSQGRFVYIHPDENLMSGYVKGDCVFSGSAIGTKRVKNEDSDDFSEVYYGNALFSGKALPWKEGTYEMRLHNAQSHAVIAISKPFEIQATLPNMESEGLTINSVSKTFLRILNQCLSVTITSKSEISEKEAGCSENIYKNNTAIKEIIGMSDDQIFEKEDSKMDDTVKDVNSFKDTIGNIPKDISSSGNEPKSLKSKESAELLTRTTNSIGCFDEGIGCLGHITLPGEWYTQVISPMKTMDDPIGISGSLSEPIAKRLADCITAYFKIDYSYEVLILAAKNNLTVRTVALHIYNGRCALDAFVRDRAESLVSPVTSPQL